MNIYSVKVLVKPDETLQDVIAEVCDEGDVDPDEPFVFSAIMRPDDESGCRVMKINSLVDRYENVYSVREVVTDLMTRKVVPTNGIVYIQPPIEKWFEIFRPLLLQMTAQVRPRYEKLIPDQDEVLSILYTTVFSLYDKGYYLHRTLIYKSFVNALNYECRYLKHLQNVESLDRPIDVDEEGKEITLLDQIPDADSSAWAKSCHEYTEDDYWNDMYERLKSCMLQDMSEFQFKRILVQLATKTVDRSTSYKLQKYRRMFNPDYVPRPNARGKNKGGK